MGSGYIDIFIHRLRPFWGVYFFFNFNIFLGFQINEYFSGMKILWIFLRGHHKLDKLGGISMYFWVSSKGSGT